MPKLTPFKEISEYIISVSFLVSIFTLLKYRHEFHPETIRLLVFDISLTIISELAFTLYADVYVLYNMAGHYLKIISFWFIYRAIIEIGFKKPYDLLLRGLIKKERALRDINDQLEIRVGKGEYNQLFLCIPRCLSKIPVYRGGGVVDSLKRIFLSMMIWYRIVCLKLFIKTMEEI